MSESYELYTDGGARGNPGPAAVGCVLMLGGTVVAQLSRTIGEATNNQAEYEALRAGLDLAYTHGVRSLRCFLDSELVVLQLQGVYRVKNQDLKRMHAKILSRATDFDEISYASVPRDKNTLADALVNKALDGAR